MKKRLLTILAALSFMPVTGTVPVVFAGLESVSGINNTEIFADGNPANVALAPPGGPSANYPLWYKDTNGLKLTLCLDGEEGAAPCHWEGAPVFTDAGCTTHFYEYENVVGFGNEGFYYKVQSYPFDVPLNIGGFVQLQYLVETTWGADTRFDPVTGQVEGQDIWLRDEAGQCVSSVGADLHRVEEGYEMLFSRLRLRLLDTAPAGWYRMTHPYGVKTIYRQQADVDETRRTETRQLVGDLLIPDPDNGWVDSSEQNFLIALNDPYLLIDATNPDPFNHPFIGLRPETGFVNDGDYTDVVERQQLKSVGPFLHKPDYLTDPTLQIADENGVVQQYLGTVPDEVNPAASPGHPVAGSQFIDPLFPGEGLVNQLRVRYLFGNEATPPSDQDWVNASVVGETSNFNVIGKVFQDPLAQSLFPNGGEILTKGSTQQLTWASVLGADSYRLRYFDADNTIHRIDNVGAVTEYSWTVPLNALAEAGKRFRVTAFSGGALIPGTVQWSEAPFTIASQISPNGGETLNVGQPFTLTWAAVPGADRYRLFYFDADNTPHPIGVVLNRTSFDWTVPVDAAGVGKRFRVAPFAGTTGIPSGIQRSEGTFTIE